MKITTLVAFVVCMVSIGGISHSNQHTDPVKAIDWVKLTVLIDNHPYDGLRAPWGLSVFVETKDTKFLWDTGPEPEDLLYNAEKLGINLKDIAFVGISHEHHDHVGGLPAIAKLHQGLTVYVPKDMNHRVFDWIKHLNLNPIPVQHTKKVANGIAIIGELYGPPYEEAIAVNLKRKGLIVLVGCSHPRVDNIVSAAVKSLHTQAYAVIGGFHLLNSPHWKIKRVIPRLMDMGVKKIAAIHCSGDFTRNFLKDTYPDNYTELHVGSSLTLGY